MENSIIFRNGQNRFFSSPYPTTVHITVNVNSSNALHALQYVNNWVITVIISFSGAFLVSNKSYVFYEAGKHAVTKK